MLNAPSLPKNSDFFVSLSFVTLLYSSITPLKFPSCKSQSTEPVFFSPPLKYALQSVPFTLGRSMINLLPSPFSHTKPLSVSTFSPRQRADSHALCFSATARQCGCICPHPFCPLSIGCLIQLKSFPFPPPCPLYQCHFFSIFPCLSSCMQNTQCCALSHAALSSIFLPDDWRCSSASFFSPPTHTSLSVQNFFSSKAS